MVFVGRETELDLLEREIALAMEICSGRCIFVEGSPGAGKTALITEFLERIAKERPNLAIARGRCLQTFGSADPYLPFVDALKDLSDEKTAGSINRETLSGLLTELAPYWLSVVPLVGGLLSATYATAAKLRGQAPAGAAPSREALFVQYLEVIRKLAEQGPLLLFLDDLHWSDHSSVALLAHLSRGISQLPVAILGTLRRTDAELEKHPILDIMRELEREDLGKRVQLGDMPEETLPALLGAEFGGYVSDPLCRWMRETAGGNPLFVSELARLLMQSGAAVEENGEWFLTEAVKEIEVPRSAEAVVESRIQRLEPEEVRILQYASVEGNEFNSTVVSQLLEEDELEVLDALEKMERRYGLVKTTGEIELPDGDFATTYRFRHALAQTVLYKQVVGKRRILLHRKAAEALEAMFQDSLDEVAGKLARHFSQGRVKDSAYRFARQAADRARLIYAHWEAEELFRIALENSPGDSETADLEERLGDVYDVVGYYPKGIEFYQKSLDKCGDSSALRVRRKILVLERKAGLTPAPALLQRVRALLEEAKDQLEEHCHLLLETGRLPDAVGVVESHRDAVTIAESLENPLLLAQSLERLAVVLVFAGRTDEAFPFLERALDIVNRTGDLLASTRARNIAGIAHARLGRYRDAMREFEEMSVVAERLGDPNSMGAVYGNLGAVLLRLGEYEKAEQALQKAYSIHKRRDRSTQLQSLFNLAERARLGGDLPLAVERYEHLIELAREFEYWNSEAVAHAGLGLSLLETARLDEARECAWRALAAVTDREAWFEDRDILEIFLARLEALDGTPERAVERLAGASQILAAADTYLWARVELERARILREIDGDRAREIVVGLGDATATFQSPPLQAEITIFKGILRIDSALAAPSEQLT